MASFSRGTFISGRGKKSLPGHDLRSVIASKKAASLRCEYIGVIGAEMTGRNTLVRRFLHMSEGPFDAPEDRKYSRRSVLVELSQRPYIHEVDVVKLNVHILNARSRSYEDFYQIIPTLQSIVMIFDVRSERTLNIAKSCLNRIRQQLQNVTPPRFILVGNKIDLPVTDTVLNNIREEANNCGAENYYECSALMNINMDPVLDAILILTFYPNRPLPP
ncbi:hypothetical protein HNY73_022958 [Argiope bruennichi]|uniref:Uncharacterized protein n=1 Tax=Argiope bruennichi TaxID=94029 RepID=A0A8T0E503_ARGBR|nr:hypothetical protein HNY73_022958 [Argiope bruennichi]